MRLWPMLSTADFIEQILNTRLWPMLVSPIIPFDIRTIESFGAPHLYRRYVSQVQTCIFR